MTKNGQIDIFGRYSGSQAFIQMNHQTNNITDKSLHLHNIQFKFMKESLQRHFNRI